MLPGEKRLFEGLRKRARESREWYEVMGLITCCSKPRLRKAWAPYWPFRAVYCANCSAVVLTCGPVAAWVWEHIYAVVWPGQAFKVQVERGKRL